MLATPAVTPVTFPEASTDATDELLLLQVPPAGLLLKPDTEPAQIVVVPEMDAGAAVTVTTTVLVQPEL
jgi:hypothetical protein